MACLPVLSDGDRRNQAHEAGFALVVHLNEKKILASINCMLQFERDMELASAYKLVVDGAVYLLW